MGRRNDLGWGGGMTWDRERRNDLGWGGGGMMECEEGVVRRGEGTHIN